MPAPTLTARTRRRALVLTLALGLALAPLSAVSAADPTPDAAEQSSPSIDRGLVLLGCMGGLALGAVSVVLPPASAWVAAGVMGGGLGTMIVRAGFGCIYGGLGGAVASLSRSLVRWIDAGWRAWKGRPVPRPLAIEGQSGS